MVGIAFLRGINLGKVRRISMESLKSMMLDLGFTDVKTHLNTGNVIFRTLLELTPKEIEIMIKEKIQMVFGFEVPIAVRMVKDLEEIIKNNPFSKVGDENNYHIGFINKPLDLVCESYKDEFDGKVDTYKIIGKTIYLYCTKLYSDTKYGNNYYEKKYKVISTMRNYKVVCKVLELAKNIL